MTTYCAKEWEWEQDVHAITCIHPVNEETHNLGTCKSLIISAIAYYLGRATEWKQVRLVPEKKSDAVLKTLRLLFHKARTLKSWTDTADFVTRFKNSFKCVRELGFCIENQTDDFQIGPAICLSFMVALVDEEGADALSGVEWEQCPQ